MSTVVKPNKNGELVVPRELVNAVTPHERFEVDVQGNALIARPVQEEQPLWATLSPKERAEEFRQWVKSLKPKARHLSDEAMRRENMYD